MFIFWGITDVVYICKLYEITLHMAKVISEVFALVSPDSCILRRPLVKIA